VKDKYSMFTENFSGNRRWQSRPVWAGGGSYDFSTKLESVELLVQVSTTQKWTKTQ